MASSSSMADLFQRNQVSSSVSPDESQEFLEKHGFFYEENDAIGNLVDELYRTGRARSHARLCSFEPTLRENLRLSRILDNYPNETRFRFPWGTTPGAYYNWVRKTSSVNSELIAYMLGPESQYDCRDLSHEVDSDGVLEENGTFEYPDAVVENYSRRDVEMKKGGVLLVHPRFILQATTGRSIMLGLRKGTAGS